MTIYASKQCAFNPANINKTSALICLIIHTMVISIYDQTWTKFILGGAILNVEINKWLFADCNRVMNSKPGKQVFW